MIKTKSTYEEAAIDCPACGDKMEPRKARLMGLDVSSWVCTRCSEAVYDFSDKGESCGTCSACNVCLWR
jgi:ssDNA-binding Zn-finger/Zn-ribbon topoisomerase 1